MGLRKCFLVVCGPRYILFKLKFTDNKCGWIFLRAGTGFKLNIRDLTSLTLSLGPNTTTPQTKIGVSIDYGPYKQVQVQQGENEVPLGAINGKKSGSNTIVRIVLQGWENNRVVLENIKVNEVRFGERF